MSKPLILTDSANAIHWFLTEIADGETGKMQLARFDSLMDEAKLNIATQCNLAIPHGTKVDGKWKLDWGTGEYTPTEEFRKRPVKPIRDFVKYNYRNDKLQVPELIKVLDKYEGNWI